MLLVFLSMTKPPSNGNRHLKLIFYKLECLYFFLGRPVVEQLWWMFCVIEKLRSNSGAE